MKSPPGSSFPPDLRQHPFSLSAELDGKNKSRDYKNLTGITVKKGEWTKLEGLLTVPDDPNLEIDPCVL